MTSVRDPSWVGGFVSLRLSYTMGRLPSPSSFILKIHSQCRVQYLVCCC